MRPSSLTARALRTQTQDDRGLGRVLHAGTGQLEPPGEHRIHDDAIAIEVDHEELAPPPDGGHGLPDKGRQLGRSATDGQWAGRLDEGDRTPPQGGVEGLGDDRQIG